LLLCGASSTAPRAGGGAGRAESEAGRTSLGGTCSHRALGRARARPHLAAQPRRARPSAIRGSCLSPSSSPRRRRPPSFLAWLWPPSLAHALMHSYTSSVNAAGLHLLERQAAERKRSSTPPTPARGGEQLVDVVGSCTVGEALELERCSPRRAHASAHPRASALHH